MNRLLTVSVLMSISLFLFANIYYSQVMSPLYFELVNEDKKTVLVFLKKTIKIPEFNFMLEMAKNNYGKSLEGDIFWQKKGRENQIDKLKQILKTNPKARDVLYGLYLEYKSDGNDAKANEWLSKAKEVDPTL